LKSDAPFLKYLGMGMKIFSIWKNCGHLNKSGDNNADLCILYLNLDNNYSKTLVTTQIDMSPSNCWALKLQKD